MEQTEWQKCKQWRYKTREICMKNFRILYMKYAVKKLKEKLLTDICGFKRKEESKICGYILPSDEEANLIIANYIRAGEPFCLLRPGNGEYSLANQWDEYRMFGTKRYRNQKMYITVLDGIDHYAERWVETFEEDLKQADIFVCFNYAHFEHYLVERYAVPQKIILLGQLHALRLDNPWWWALEGKKVLVISPFVDTMKKQYQKRDFIWGDKKVLPEMDIRFVKSVWYLSADDNSGFPDWFAALAYLYEEVSKVEFEIALISCGPFSTFLAAQIKRDGKQAIQCGGFLQILFGMRGARWDNVEDYNQYFNQYWERPSKEDAPKGWRKMDDGCYW